MSVIEEINKIIPGENYPSFVTVTEKIEGHDTPVKFKFLFQSYAVGMYIAIYADGNLVQQAGDHDNKRSVKGLKQDLLKAVERGAVVEVGDLRPIKTEF